MIRLIVMLFLVLLFYWVIKGIFSRSQASIGEKRRTQLGPEEVMVQDPECGVYIHKGDAITSMSDGQSFYFCSKECLDRYRMKDSKRS